MISTAQQMQDLTTFKHIKSSLEKLENRFETARNDINARERGYLLPDEDRRVRRLFRTFLSHRDELYKLVERHRDGETNEDLDQYVSFLISFGSALLLYDYVVHLVELYQDVDVIRQKLNEPAPAFDIETNSFERLNRSVTSFRNLRKLRHTSDFFEEHRDEMLRELHEGCPRAIELFNVVDQRYEHVRQDPGKTVVDHVTRDAEWLRRTVTEPFRRMQESVTSWLLTTAGDVWFERDRLPRIPREHRERFAERLRPGDIYLVRAERKTTTMVFPGFWSHSVMYLGTPSDLREGPEESLDAVRKNTGRIERSAGPGRHAVVESLAPGVIVNSMGRSMTVDHAVALRPNLSESERLRAVNDALEQVGKPYDFSFDVSRADRLVCSELLYRSLHGKGPIQMNPVERLGKPTYAADDLANYAGEMMGKLESPFEFLAMSTRDEESGEAQFLTGEEGRQAFVETSSATEPV